MFVELNGTDGAALYSNPKQRTGVTYCGSFSSYFTDSWSTPPPRYLQIAAHPHLVCLCCSCVWLFLNLYIQEASHSRDKALSPEFMEPFAYIITPFRRLPNKYNYLYYTVRIFGYRLDRHKFLIKVAVDEVNDFGLRKIWVWILPRALMSCVIPIPLPSQILSFPFFKWELC